MSLCVLLSIFTPPRVYIFIGKENAENSLTMTIPRVLDKFTIRASSTMNKFP